MSNEIDAIVTSLRDLHADEGVNQAYATVDRLNREGRTDDLDPSLVFADLESRRGIRGGG